MNLAHTNAYVFEKASQELNKNRTNNLCEIRLFLELVQQKNCQSVGHMLTALREDPLRQVSYPANSAAVYPIHRRLFYSDKYIWEHVLRNPFNPYTSSNVQKK